MAPRHVLGDGTGDLPIVLLGSSLEILWNANTGRSTGGPEPSLKRVEISQPALGGTFRVNGAKLSFSREVNSLDSLVDILETLRLAMPAALSLYLPSSVAAVSAVAQSGESIVRSEVNRSASPMLVITQAGYEQRVAGALRATDILLNRANRALLASVIYAHVASRLDQVGTNTWEFMSERILNYAKCLEVLFGDRRDDIRAEARKLGYEEPEIEGIFVALTVLRDSLDVAHAKVSTYSDESLARIYSFLVELPAAMNELLQRAVEEVRQGTWRARDLRERAEPADLTRLLTAIENGLSARQRRIVPERADSGPGATAT